MKQLPGTGEPDVSPYVCVCLSLVHSFTLMIMGRGQTLSCINVLNKCRAFPLQVLCRSRLRNFRKIIQNVLKTHI